MNNKDRLESLLVANQIDLRRAPLFDTAPPDLVEGVWDRIGGMMLGLAIGDALGNTSEGLLRSQRYAIHGEIRDYIPNRHAGNRGVGLPSDDTQLAFWSLEQMLEDGEFIPEHVAKRFAGGQIFGIGGTVLSFLRSYKSGAPWYECGQHSAGNGALMRIAPTLIPHVNRPSTALWVDTALSATMTHNDSSSIAACLAFVRLLWEVMVKEVPPEPEWWLRRYVETTRDLEIDKAYRPRGGKHLDYCGPLWRYTELVVGDAWRKELTVKNACNVWYSGAYLMETVPSVLYILMRYGSDPKEAIVRAVNDTKDNDTIAAIVGAAVGAVHGRSALPKRWLKGLLGRTEADDDGKAFTLLEAARSMWAP